MEWMMVASLLAGMQYLRFALHSPSGTERHQRIHVSSFYLLEIGEIKKAHSWNHFPVVVGSSKGEGDKNISGDS